MSVIFVNPVEPSNPASSTSVSLDIWYASFALVGAPIQSAAVTPAAPTPSSQARLQVTYYGVNGKIGSQRRVISDPNGPTAYYSGSFHFSFTPPTGTGVHEFTISITKGLLVRGLGFGVKDITYKPTYALQATNQTPHLLINGKTPKPELAYIGTDAAKTAHLTLGGTYRIRFGLNTQTTTASGAKKQTFQPIPSDFTLGNAVKFKGARPDPSIDLFNKGVVFLYQPQQAKTPGAKPGLYHKEVVLQAVHLGKQTLTITPKPPKGQPNPLKPIKITLSVEKPARLGPKDFTSYRNGQKITTPNPTQYDAGIYKIAGPAGIPPQMMKGQIDQESRFDPYAWRYEPVNEGVGDPVPSLKPRDFRDTTSPYTGYRLPTIGDSTNPGDCPEMPGKKPPKGKKPPYNYALHVDSRIPDGLCPGLSQGTNILPLISGSSTEPQVMSTISTANQDASDPATRRPGIYPIYVPERYGPKSKKHTPGCLVFATTAKGQHCDSGGRPVMELLSDSNYQYLSARDIIRYNQIQNYARFGSPSIVNAIKTGKTDFTAQLSLAASYGFMQVTYVTAIGHYFGGGYWNGVNMPFQTGPDMQDCSAYSPKSAAQVLDPYYLFDTPCNVYNGGGSLTPGTRVLLGKYRYGGGHIRSLNPKFKNIQQLVAFFAEFYQNYNSRLSGYGQDIVKKSTNYYPVPLRRIFPKGVAQ